MASIAARKEEERKRESHRQTLLKVFIVCGCSKVTVNQFTARIYIQFFFSADI